MSALAPLDAHARQRLLALIGIDVYLQRAPRGLAPAVSEPAPDRRVAVATTARLRVECDLSDAGAEPLSGPYAALLRQVLQAFGAAPREVHFLPLAAADGAPGMRLSTDSSAFPVPALAEVRNSGAAKRKLWTALRALRSGEGRR